MCMAEPACKLFIANSLCCLDYGIVQHASVRLWMVCTADVYLPEPKCLTVMDRYNGVIIPPYDPAFPEPLSTVNVSVLDTPNARSEEMLVDLPLAYYVPPIGAVPGQLPLELDFEQKRMSESDGLCSLRLRTPCEWEGALYEAVGPVQAIPLTSVLSANETALAEELVKLVLEGAPPLPAPAPDFGVTESPAPLAAPVITSGPADGSTTADQTVVFEFTSSGPASTGTFECRLADSTSTVSDPLVHTDWLPCTSPVSYPALPDGSYQFSVRQQGSTQETTVNFVEAAGTAAPSPALAISPSPVLAPAPEELSPPLVSGAPGGAPGPSPSLLPSPSPLVSGAPEGAPPPGPGAEAPGPAAGLSPDLGPPSPAELLPSPSPGLTPPPPMLAPAPSTPTGTAVIGRRLRSLASRLRDTVLGGGRSDSRSRSLGTAAGSAGGSAASLAHEAAAQHGAGGRRLLQDLLASDSGVADSMLFEYMNTNQLLGDQVEVDPLSFGAPSIFSGASFRSAQTVVGGELPEPAVDPSVLPPLTDVLLPVFNQTDLWDDYFISWLPANETEGACLMTNSADLPEAFLLGDFEELVGYEEECSPESLPEVGSGEMDPLLTAGLGRGAAGGAALPPTDSTRLIG